MKYRIALLGAVLAATVALLLPGTALAATCQANNTYSAGYQKATADWPTEVDANIVMNSRTRRSGDLRSYLKLTNNQGDTIQVGIRDNGNGPEIYLLYDGTYEFVNPASVGHSYLARIVNVDGSGEFWDAHMGGYSRSSLWAPIWTNPVTQYLSTSNTGSGTVCNSFNFSDVLVAPWPTSNMTKVQVSPYSVSNIATWGWDASGP